MPQIQLRLRRIRSDQMYHRYLGDPLEVLLLYPDGRSEVRVEPPDVEMGDPERLQASYPAGKAEISAFAS